VLNNGARARATVDWRKIRYRRWQEEQGLRPALLRLALTSSLMQPPLTADTRVGLTDLSGDVISMVGDAVESALRFCGVLFGHTNWVVSAQFSPDEQKIVSASHDYMLRVWSTATGECKQTLRGNTGITWC
jgi:WD40 repeat protein